MIKCRRHTSIRSAIWGIFNGSQCAAFPRKHPPHCTISCYDCILRQCSQIAVTTAISRNIADPSLLKFSRWDIVMWPWRRQPGNSELPSPPALWSAGSSTSRPLPHTGRITSLPNHTLFARYSIYNPYSLGESYDVVPPCAVYWGKGWDAS
jgi:hypothetical protein